LEEDEHTARLHRTISAIHHHQQRMDSLWRSLPRQLRQDVHRLYPPVSPTSKRQGSNVSRSSLGTRSSVLSDFYSPRGSSSSLLLRRKDSNNSTTSTSRSEGNLQPQQQRNHPPPAWVESSSSAVPPPSGALHPKLPDDDVEL
jgi:hypothetical protein